MYLAGYIVAGSSWPGSTPRAHLRGRRDRYHRAGLVVALSFAALAAPVQVVGRRLGRPRGRRGPADQARRDRGPGEHDRRAAPVHLRRLVRRRRRRCRAASRSLSCCRCSPSTTRTRPSGARQRARWTTGRRSTSCASRSRGWSAIGTGLAVLARALPAHVVAPRAAAALEVVLPRGVAAGPLALVALICGWITTEVGRQPWIVYEIMRTSDAVTGGGRARGRLRGARRGLHGAGARGRRGCCAASPRKPERERGGRADAARDLRRRSSWSA